MGEAIKKNANKKINVCKVCNHQVEKVSWLICSVCGKEFDRVETVTKPSCQVCTSAYKCDGTLYCADGTDSYEVYHCDTCNIHIPTMNIIGSNFRDGFICKICDKELQEQDVLEIILDNGESESAGTEIEKDDWSNDDWGVYEPSEIASDQQTNDAEIEQFQNGNKFASLPIENNSPSIVPDDVSVITLVALIFDGVVAAYRFKTDMGYYDITRKKAIEYGVSGYKVEKAIKLERYNGMLVTQSEINNQRCIPDITGSDEDCEKLFNALFKEPEDDWGTYETTENVLNQQPNNITSKRAKYLSPSVQYAITTALANIMNGAFWGFTDMKNIQSHIEAIKAEPNITARKLGNACLIEVQPGFLLNAVQAIDPNAITQGDLNNIQRSMAEALIAFEKFLISKGKLIAKGTAFGGTVGIYCINDTENIVFKGTNYPAFRVTMGDALRLLAQYGYEINVGGRFTPAMQAVNAGNALWESANLSPTKTGIFIDIRSTLSAEQIKAKEAEFKQRYGLV